MLLINVSSQFFLIVFLMDVVLHSFSITVNGIICPKRHEYQIMVTVHSVHSNQIMAASKATIFTFILAHLLRFWQYYIIPKRISWQDNFNVKKVPVSIFRQKRHLPGMLLSADWRFPVRRSLRRYTGSLQLCSPESYLRLWSGRQCRGRLPARCGCNPEIQKESVLTMLPWPQPCSEHVTFPANYRLDMPGTVKHAWITVYIRSKGWVDKGVEFSGDSWSRMDPTFDSNSQEWRNYSAIS